MTNISFGSNYRFNAGSQYPAAVLRRLSRCEIPGALLTSEFTSPKEAMETGIYEKFIFSVPDRFDKNIDAFFKANNINFQKQSLSEAMDPANIKSRILLSETDAEFGYLLVEFDTDKLDELFKKDEISYIEPGGKNGIGNRYKGVSDFLKTGQAINAVRVCFREDDGKLKASIIDGRHRFAFMRDIGLRKIPVSIEESSYNIAKKYGLC